MNPMNLQFSGAGLVQAAGHDGLSRGKPEALLVIQVICSDRTRRRVTGLVTALSTLRIAKCGTRDPLGVAVRQESLDGGNGAARNPNSRAILRFAN
jgi:hypothetical protein